MKLLNFISSFHSSIFGVKTFCEPAANSTSEAGCCFNRLLRSVELLLLHCIPSPEIRVIDHISFRTVFKDGG